MMSVWVLMLLLMCLPTGITWSSTTRPWYQVQSTSYVQYLVILVIKAQFNDWCGVTLDAGARVQFRLTNTIHHEKSVILWLLHWWDTIAITDKSFKYSLYYLLNSPLNISWDIEPAIKLDSLFPLYWVFDLHNIPSSGPPPFGTRLIPSLSVCSSFCLCVSPSFLLEIEPLLNMDIQKGICPL